MIGYLVQFVKVVVMIAIAFFVVTWFVANAAPAGQFVGNFIDAIFTFFESLGGSLPSM